jgi:general L-amino acid transport system permease protein
VNHALRLSWHALRFSWNDARTRAVAWQVAAVVVVCAIATLVAIQTIDNLEQRGIVSGFDYLTRAAGFEIAASPMSYSSGDSNARALAVGLVNSLRVALLGILIATALGIVIGVARLSKIWVVSASARAYVELMRNTPLLLQLLFWYSLSQSLPEPRAALNPFPGVFLCFQGLFLPRLAWRDGSLGLEHAALSGFGFQGGTSVSPEFAALLIGLSTCTAAFIGEIVRGGILSVGKGQMEAAAALGLSRRKVLRLVVLPQALPVILPPTTSQFLNVIKNSSLAVAIGYADLISITNTTLNQTGQAIEAISLAMVVYVAISLLVSLAMNVYDNAAAWRAGGGHHG